jgi:sugar phosphate permease
MQIINRIKSSDFFDLRYIYIYSFTLTISRAAILPFLAIYLSQAYEISIETLGVLLSATLIIGTISSLFGGYFVDNLSRLPLLIFLALSTAFLFGIIPSLN